MAFTAYRTWVTGEVVTAAMMNEQVRDDGNFDHNAHGCHLYISTGGSVVTATTTTMGDGSGAGGSYTEAEDTDAYHSSGAFITIPTGLAGVYEVKAALHWPSGATGKRQVFSEKNSATLLAACLENAPSSGDSQQQATRIVRLAVGDTVRMRGFQSQGTNLTVTTGEGNSFLSAWLIGA